MKSAFRIVGGLDFDATQDRDEKRARAEDRKRAAPLHRDWIQRIEHHLRAGYLLPIDLMLARELLNYPSANHGKCYAGRKRLAEKLGIHPRSIDYALQRLEGCQLLKSRRGAAGKTATRYFCVNGRFVFGGDAFLPLKNAGQIANLESQGIANKPIEQHKTSEQSLPLSPAETIEQQSSSDDELHGEIIQPSLSFDEFWTLSGKQGSEGFARAQWRRLNSSDIAALSDRLLSDPHTIRRGIWSGTWLRDRLWLQPKEEATEEVEPEIEPRRYVHAEPGSELWRLERERRRALGENITLMDDWAREGRGVTVDLNRFERSQTE